MKAQNIQILYVALKENPATFLNMGLETKNQVPVL